MGKRYYDNYDYEEAYKEQCKKLEEAEMERWMKEGWVNCLYRTSTYKSTNTESNTTLLESMVYPSFKFKADMGNVKVSAEEVESYDIEECTAILNAYMEFVDELKANPN